MAIGATIHTFETQLSDVDRDVYEQLSLRVARHPSETDVYMVTRVLAYLLEYQEGIGFAGGGVSSTDEPAVLVRDLTGQITKWIEVGAPDADRLHHGSKLAGDVAVYTHRDIDQLLGSWAGKKIHRAEHIVARAFDRRFVDAAAAELGRRNTVTCSVMEGQLYLELNGVALETAIGEYRLS